ncbi:MAG TPA: flagellar assembly protein FliH [Ideonella sp.]|nr:flagellar assembly protein FliH [Ideonella sp.]
MITRVHRFPPLSQLRDTAPADAAGAVSAQVSYAEGFQAGQDTGYREGFESGRQEGLANGQREGLALGRREGVAEARQAAMARFDSLSQPLEALFGELQQLQDDYQSALRKEVVDLVAKVARQVIRCELALQPVQLLSLVDETLATMPPTPKGVEVYLNPEDLQRIQELAPERASRWSLLADAALEPGECRVKAGTREADAGCRQRLAACMEQIGSQLQTSPGPQEPAVQEPAAQEPAVQAAPTPAPAPASAPAPAAADKPAPRKRAAKKPARSEEQTA